jgi:hypothetical protein
VTAPICHPVRYAVLPDAPSAQAAGHPCIDRPLAYPADLVWRADDPLAVEIAFPATPTCKSVEWLFALDLLEHGLDRPAGAWDVRVRPAAADRVEVVLDPVGGQAALHFAADDIRRFLAAVAAVWAPVHVDDAELAAWLARAEQ